jgi:uncharacterized membrane protein YbhN (UPF0104 family)
MRRRLALIAGAGVSLLCVAAVVAWALRQKAPSVPSAGAAALGFGLAISLYALNTGLRAERWHRLLLAGGARPRRTDTYALTVVGYFGNNTLPARAGDAMRVLLLAPRGGGSRREIAGTLLAERLLDVAVLLAFFVVVAISLVGELRVPHVPSLVLALFAAALVAMLVAAWALWSRRRQAFARPAAWLAPVASSTRRLRGRHGRDMALLSVAIWLVETGVWWTAGIAAGLSMSPLEAVYLVSMASLFSLIPSGPGYAGTQDAAIVIGARAIGARGSTAVTYLLVVRFVLLVPITLAGFVLVLTRYGGLRRVRGVISRPSARPA